MTNEHAADLNLMRGASRLIRSVVLRESFLEHERDAFAHHAHGVDRVHYGFGMGLQQVPVDNLYHAATPQ